MLVHAQEGKMVTIPVVMEISRLCNSLRDRILIMLQKIMNTLVVMAGNINSAGIWI
jgi:hypothetical protein